MPLLNDKLKIARPEQVRTTRWIGQIDVMLFIVFLYILKKADLGTVILTDICNFIALS